MKTRKWKDLKRKTFTKKQLEKIRRGVELEISKLKPCPFCGGRPDGVTVGQGTYAIRAEIVCCDCLVSMVGFGRTKRIARLDSMLAWNRRSK